MKVSAEAARRFLGARHLLAAARSLRVAYLATDRELEVITEVFSGTPDAD